MLSCLMLWRDASNAMTWRETEIKSERVNNYFKSTLNLTLTLSLTESPCTDRPG